MSRNVGVSTLEKSLHFSNRKGEYYIVPVFVIIKSVLLLTAESVLFLSAEFVV